MKKTTIGIVFLAVLVIVSLGGLYTNYDSNQRAADAYKLMGSPVRPPAAVFAAPSEEPTHYLSVHDKAKWIRDNDHNGDFSITSDEEAARLYDDLNRATGGK